MPPCSHQGAGVEVGLPIALLWTAAWAAVRTASSPLGRPSPASSGLWGTSVLPAGRVAPCSASAGPWDQCPYGFTGVHIFCLVSLPLPGARQRKEAVGAVSRLCPVAPRPDEAQRQPEEPAALRPPGPLLQQGHLVWPPVVPEGLSWARGEGRLLCLEAEPPVRLLSFLRAVG